MKIVWSDWQDLTTDNVNRLVPESAVFAVYEIRLVDCCGKPIPLKRRLGIDENGITYIGASGVLKAEGPRLRDRFRLHIRAHVKGKKGDSLNKGLEELTVFWDKITKKYGQAAWLHYRYTMVSSSLEAKNLERCLQAEHQASFGEKHDYLWKNQAHPLFP